jgi:hypothetical protein
MVRLASRRPGSLAGFCYWHSVPIVGSRDDFRTAAFPPSGRANKSRRSEAETGAPRRRAGGRPQRVASLSRWDELFVSGVAQTRCAQDGRGPDRGLSGRSGWEACCAGDNTLVSARPGAAAPRMGAVRTAAFQAAAVAISGSVATPPCSGINQAIEPGGT